MNENTINEMTYIKKFEVIRKVSPKTKKEYYVLSVTNIADKTVELFLSESQFEMMKLVGIENCKVNIEPRVSKDNKNYDVIALRIEDDVFDFFPRDKAFISLAKLTYQKKTQN